ncbi:MAG: tetratricopeptide repeat protein [Treponema sp.]|jgi:tetratricopeptide (TPR) repeat protein|nr:tetratricopeptide repeat protein [Treponema sp.]
MIVLTFFLLFIFSVPASSEVASSEALPDWFLPLREAIYEQELTAGEIQPLYRDISDKARAALSGSEQYIMLSRCEFMMGRAYQYEDRKDEAAAHYSEGINWAEKALKERESAEAWQMLAENISQSCAVRPTSYALANGTKVEKYAKSALAINKRNAAAQILIAARWVYAPSPFHNYRRGIEMMSAIPNESYPDKDDMFNVYIAIGYAYVQQKKYAEARPWLLKSLEIYPANKYVQTLLAKK